MRTARLVGPTADGTSVVLLTEDGEELQVPLDADDPSARAVLQQLRDRLGTDPGQAGDRTSAAPDPDAPTAPAPARRPPRRRETTPMDTPLSPRDIQTRIRAGESLEELLASSGLDADRVERFAAPVLAEREHMALTALSGSVRRRGESSGHRPLRTVVAERLLGQGVDADDVTWDAWKRDDGQWQVSADYALLEQERHAEFRFDPQGRFCLAEDDDARWLAGERPSPVAAVVDRDDELALVRATSEPDRDAEPAAGVHDDPQGDSLADAQADLDDDFHLGDEVTEQLELTEEVVTVLQVVPEHDDATPPHEDAPAPEQADPEDDDQGDADEEEARARDEAAEPTVAVVRHLTRVSVEVDGAAGEDGGSGEGARSALDTLYDMLGGDGYTEDSARVYAGLSDATAVPVVDEHDFDPPAAVVVPAEPGPEAPDRAAEDEPDEPSTAPTDEDVVTTPRSARGGTTEHARGPATGGSLPDDVPLPLGGEDPADPAEPGRVPDAAEAPPVPDVDEPLIPSPGASRKPGRRKRASVPSWDEIMFGGPKQG